MKRLRHSAALLVLFGSLSPVSEASDKIEIWAVDPLIKVFPDAKPADGEAMAEVARGEHASLQVAVRCDMPMEQLQAKVEPLTREGAAHQRLSVESVRFVGYVPVSTGMPNPPEDRLRVPPAYFPDPLLLEQPGVRITPGSAHAIWITIPIPLQAVPGMYRGQVEVSAQVDGEAVAASLPVAVDVYAAQVERTRLWVTNWFRMAAPPGMSRVKRDSQAYWDMLRGYARNMAAHRQNVALISPLSLADFSVGDDGRLAIDFDRFDKWVEIFIEEGVVGRIEGGHIGTRAAGWSSPFVVRIRQVQDGKIKGDKVDPASPKADAFYGRFFPALVKHLKAKGWLDRYMQHLADEPVDANADSYRAMAALVHKYAPELPVIEACQSKTLEGAIQIWVPVLGRLHSNFEHYRQRQDAGEEVWFYTCLGPQGEYANRFVEQPLIKTRLLHWINFRYGVTGYLHWGYNYWLTDDPFQELIAHSHFGTPLPAGDSWIVYPHGEDGVLDSIRFEAMRDGIVDHELLSQLAERDPETARRLAKKHVLDFDRYETDVSAFRATRRRILELLSKP